MMEFNRADSIFRILEKELVSNVDSVLQNNCWLNRLSCFLYMEESDSATAILNKYGIVVDESSDNIYYLLTMARYYTATKDFAKSELLLERACHYAKTDDDLIYCYFFLYKLADRQGDAEKALKFYTYYSSLQNASLRDLLSNPVLGAQFSNYRSVSELESTKARNKITILVALVIITILVVFIISYISWNRRQRAEHLKREYLSTINELTSQISINRDKISTLNTRVRELLRNQFDSSDYLYTRYYEQIDDNKKVVLGDYDIRGVIFDIDGVLLDSLGIWKDLGARYLIRQGKEPESGLSETLFSMSMEEGTRYLKEHYLPDLSETKISEGLENMLRDFYYYEVWAKPGAEALLKACRDAGLRVTAATSSPRSHIERALYRNGLLGYIERIYTNAEVGFSKHSPEIYDRAAAGMGFEREQVCVLEDSLYALKTAAAAGYHTAGVAERNGEPDQEGLRRESDIYIAELTAAADTCNHFFN